MKKKLMSIVCAGAVLFGVSGFASASDLDGDIKTSGSVTIDAPQQRYHVNVGGGYWSYGTNDEYQAGKKYAWSNYKHNERTHASSVKLGSKTNDSYATKPGIMSRASIVGSKSLVAKAYWRYAE